MKSYLFVIIIIMTTGTISAQRFGLYVGPFNATRSFALESAEYINTGKPEIQGPLSAGITGVNIGATLDLEGLVLEVDGGFSAQTGGDLYTLSAYETTYTGIHFGISGELRPISAYHPDSQFDLITPYIGFEKYLGADVVRENYDEGGRLRQKWTGTSPLRLIALGANYQTPDLFDVDGLKFNFKALIGMVKAGDNPSSLGGRIDVRLLYFF